MTAPNFVSATSIVYGNTAASATTASIAVTNGDVLVAHSMRESAAAMVSIATATGSTSAWTLQQDVPGSIDANRCMARIWTATATATGNITVTFSTTGSQAYGATILVFNGGLGIGASAKADSGTSNGNPTVSLTTTTDNAAVVYCDADWNALTGTATFTASSGTPVTSVNTVTSGKYGAYASRMLDCGTAGAKTFGMSAPTGQRYVNAAIEIKGTGVAAPSATPSIMALMGVG